MSTKNKQESGGLGFILICYCPEIKHTQALYFVTDVQSDLCVFFPHLP